MNTDSLTQKFCPTCKINIKIEQHNPHDIYHEYFLSRSQSPNKTSPWFIDEVIPGLQSIINSIDEQNKLTHSQTECVGSMITFIAKKYDNSHSLTDAEYRNQLYSQYSSERTYTEDDKKIWDIVMNTFPVATMKKIVGKADEYGNFLAFHNKLGASNCMQSILSFLRGNKPMPKSPKCNIY